MYRCLAAYIKGLGFLASQKRVALKDHGYTPGITNGIGGSLIGIAGGLILRDSGPRYLERVISKKPLNPKP